MINQIYYNNAYAHDKALIIHYRQNFNSAGSTIYKIMLSSEMIVIDIVFCHSDLNIYPKASILVNKPPRYNQYLATNEKGMQTILDNVFVARHKMNCIILIRKYTLIKSAGSGKLSEYNSMSTYML